MLTFDLEKTRLWAIAVGEELDEKKVHVKKLITEFIRLKAEVAEAKAEADMVKVELAALKIERGVLLDIINAY